MPNSLVSLRDSSINAKISYAAIALKSIRASSRRLVRPYLYQDGTDQQETHLTLVEPRLEF